VKRVRLKKWGKDHFIDPKKRVFTLCGIMIPWKRLEPRNHALCVPCRKAYQDALLEHPMKNGH